MAENSYFQNFKTLDAGAGGYSVSFAPNGGADPSATYGHGVQSIVWNSTGNFTVTMTTTFPVFRGVVATINLGTLGIGDYSVLIANQTSPGPTATFDVQILLGGVAADIAGGSGAVVALFIPFSQYGLDAYAQ